MVMDDPRRLVIRLGFKKALLIIMLDSESEPTGGVLNLYGSENNAFCFWLCFGELSEEKQRRYSLHSLQHNQQKSVSGA